MLSPPREDWAGKEWEDKEQVKQEEPVEVKTEDKVRANEE